MPLDQSILRKELVALLPQLRRFAYSLAHNRADADDLLQATVERVLARSAPDDVDLLRWSFRICRNIWIDEIRARKVRQDAIRDEKIEIASAVDGERIIMGKFALNQVEQAMSQLPDDQRAALSLVALEGFSYAQTAEVLEIPIGTVMSRIARARRALVDATDAARPAHPTRPAGGKT
jgi:RNA polymerase sigma factor (sigma-70 family)